MNDTTSSFTDKLNQFGDTQLAKVSTHDIHASTMQLLLATVFFTGAAISIAKLTNTPQKTYLATLHLFFKNNFGLSTDKASGMIESNARLYKRFVLIEKIYHEGWNAACSEQSQTDNSDSALKALLKKYRNLSMSELNSEGTKEQTPAPAEVEAIIPAAPEVSIVTPPSQWRQNILLVLLVSLICGLAYTIFFTSLFPEWRSLITSTLDTLSEQYLTPLFETMIEPMFERVRTFIEK